MAFNIIILLIIKRSDAEYSGLNAQTSRAAGVQHPGSALPQLLSGDEHLGQPLQLCSLLLHGVPDPVHLPANTWCTTEPQRSHKQTATRTHKDMILHGGQECASLASFQCCAFKRKSMHQFLRKKNTQKGEVRGMQSN